MQEEEKKVEDTVMQMEVAGRTYKFICAPNSPLGEAFDVISAMRSYVVGKINEYVKAQEAEQTPKEILEPEVEVIT